MTNAELQEVLRYDPATGNFTWAVSRGGHAVAGRIAGRSHKDGYWRINVLGREYLAHRLAWLSATGEWPRGQIDHKNGTRNDNRLCNLRPATHGENARNTAIYANNSSGVKGVSWRRGKWVSQIQVSRRKIHLGYFASKEMAASAYQVAAEKFFGEFARRAA